VPQPRDWQRFATHIPFAGLHVWFAVHVTVSHGPDATQLPPRQTCPLGQLTVPHDATQVPFEQYWPAGHV